MHTATAMQMKGAQLARFHTVLTTPHFAPVPVIDSEAAPLRRDLVPPVRRDIEHVASMECHLHSLREGVAEARVLREVYARHVYRASHGR